MKTVHSFLLYSASLLGQKVLEPTNPYGGQCVAYVSHLTRWATDNRYNLAYTNAIDLLAKARANGFQVFYNDGKAQPQPGDIWVTRTYSHPYGHTGVFESVGGQPVTLEQNIDGNADALYNGGWVRRKNRLLYASGRMDYNPQIETQTLVGWFRLPLEPSQQATKEQTKRRKSGMYGSFYFTVQEGDHEFGKGTVYFYNAATNVVTGISSQDRLKAITDMYKSQYGEEMKSETYSTKAPWHRLLFSALQTRTTGYEDVDNKISGLKTEIASLANLVKGNDIANKKTFTASVALNIRDRASLSGAIVGRLAKGETVEIVGSANADKHYWISFLKDGKLVYVASKIEGGDTLGTVSE